MAPVATNDKAEEAQPSKLYDLKAQLRATRFLNPFQGAESPLKDENDEDYEHKAFNVRNSSFILCASSDMCSSMLVYS